ncbi:MAG: hypothetical protein ACOH1I_05505 [Gallionellaceae bacterium]|jgi:hypothetical protein
MISQQVGEIYSSKHSEYSETTQYCYYNGMHDLALFWSQPTPKESNGFLKQPVELALHVEHSVLFLLYRIVDICEWSDVAFNIQQLRTEQREIPHDAPGKQAQLQLTLVNADSGIIVAKRMLSMGPAMAQAIRHTLQEQLAVPCSRLEYETQVKQAYARYLDTDALLKNAWMMETAGPGIGAL